MGLGYDGKLYILAFDHRGSFQKKMFGIEGDPSPEETETITDAKKLIFEGMEEAVKRGEVGPIDPEVTAWALMAIGEMVGMRWVVAGDGTLPGRVRTELARIIRSLLEPPGQ